MLISAAMLFTAVPAFTAFADDQPTVEVSSHTANAGDEVTVKLEMKNNPGIVCFRFSVNYDKENMSLLSARESAFTGMIFGETDDLPFKFLWLDVSNGDKTTNGDIVELTFKINEGAQDAVYPIEVTYEPRDINNFNEQTVHFEIVNGEITVGEGGNTVSLPDTTSSSSGDGGTLPGGLSLPGLDRPTTPTPDNTSIGIIEGDKTASEIVAEFNASSTDSSKDSKKDKSSSDESGDTSADGEGDSSANGTSAADAEDNTSADSTDTIAEASQSDSSDNGSEDGSSPVNTALAVTGAVVALAAITAAVIVIRKKMK